VLISPLRAYVDANGQNFDWPIAWREQVMIALRAFGPMTRIQLAKITGCKEGTIARDCYDLIKQDRIHVEGFEKRGKAKRREILAITPDLIDQVT
jgi:predicted HTH transcriptional regulator